MVRGSFEIGLKLRLGSRGTGQQWPEGSNGSSLTPIERVRALCLSKSNIRNSLSHSLPSFWRQ
jgi:hypothetical protein